MRQYNSVDLQNNNNNITQNDVIKVQYMHIKIIGNG